MTEETKKSVLPIIKKKYLTILVLAGVLGLMLPEYATGTFLTILWSLLGIVALGTALLYADWNFKKIHRKLRPFIVTRYIAYIGLAFGLCALGFTIPTVIADSSLLIPYLVFWLISIVLVWQFKSIFTAAKQFKEKDSTRCEFC